MSCQISREKILPKSLACSTASALALRAMEQANQRVSLRVRQFDRFCKREGLLTQAQQAEAFGCSAPYISRLVRGLTDATGPFIAAVLDVLDCRFEEVFEVLSDAPSMRRAS